VEVFGDNAYGVGVDFTEARVMVPDDQAQTARRIIREAEAAPSEGEPEIDSEVRPEDV
jgi:chromosome condensin MukBEF MukE localization factor